MRFSFWTGNSHSWDEILHTCRHVEATGWDGIWIADHFMPNTESAEGPMHEVWSLLAALAGTVDRVRLGSLVCGNTYRHPAVLAKTAATVDNISGGRVVLGLGAGWQQNEHEKYGIEFSTVKGRLDRLEEAAELIRSLLRNDRTDFAGTHYQLLDAPLDPKPVNADMPILIGGRGEKRTLRIAARFADEWNVWATPDEMSRLGSVLDGHCADVGRDPSDIDRSAVALLITRPYEPGNPFLDSRPKVEGSTQEMIDTIGRYGDAGVDEFIVPDFTLGRVERRIEALDAFITDVASQFRD